MDQTAAFNRIITSGAAVAAEPMFVDLQPYEIPQTPDPRFITSGISALLEDIQIDLCGPERAWFYRRADLITATVGAERVAQFSASFDPAYERLDIHALRIIRDGKVINHASTIFFDVLRRERNMERLIFDGRLTIAATLPDVRVGDTVEVSYTLHGMRKSFGGRHASWTAFEWSVGICDMRLRLRAPSCLHVGAYAMNNPPTASVSEKDGITDRRWRDLKRPGIKFEMLTPPWVFQAANLQLSTWRDWAEAVDVFAPLYEENGPLPAELDAEVKRIQATEKTPEGRAAAVLRFVQSNIRYLAISMGEGGFTPRPLAEICATRYGDCKDKAKLFTAMARPLGLDACPALVNTHDGYALNNWMPCGVSFDHCITRLQIGDKIYWLDGTRLTQPSPLPVISQCYFGWALPLKPGVTALERMADPKMETLTETNESVTVGASPSEVVRYEYQQKLSGVRAEDVRARFARDGSFGVFKSYAEDLQRIWPKANPVTQEIVSDDVATNTFTVREVYEIQDAWRRGEDGKLRFHTHDITLRGMLQKIDASERKLPIYLGQPGRYTRRVEVRTGTAHQGSWLHQFRGDTIALRDEMRMLDSRHLIIEQSLELKALTLEAREAETYRKIVDKLTNNDLMLTETESGGQFVGPRTEGTPLSGWSAARYIWLGLVLVGFLARCAQMSSPPN